MENENNQMLNKPSNHLGYAIFAYLFFWPLGIPALVNAVKVNKLWYAGNYQGAIVASEAAKKWAGIAKIIGIVNIVIAYFVYWPLYMLILFATE